MKQYYVPQHHGKLHSWLTSIARAGFGYGTTIKNDYTIWDRILGLFIIARPIFLVMTPLNAAGAVVLALGRFPGFIQCLTGFLTVALAGSAVNIFNDYVDRERDRHLWQARPIPSGRLRARETLIYVLFLVAASLTMCWFLFNITAWLILFTALVLGCLYSCFLRDRVGYLALPPIVGLIYLGGWAAFAPETLFTNILPWYLYLLGVVWQAAHIMVYYPVHISSGSMQKTNPPVPPALFIRPSPGAAVKLGLGFTVLACIMALALPLIAPLGAVYFILVLGAGAYALLQSVILSDHASSREKGLKAFASLSIFRLTISIAILISIWQVSVMVDTGALPALTP